MLPSNQLFIKPVFFLKKCIESLGTKELSINRILLFSKAGRRVTAELFIGNWHITHSVLFLSYGFNGSHKNPKFPWETYYWAKLAH